MLQAEARPMEADQADSRRQSQHQRSAIHGHGRNVEQGSRWYGVVKRPLPLRLGMGGGFFLDKTSLKMKKECQSRRGFQGLPFVA